TSLGAAAATAGRSVGSAMTGMVVPSRSMAPRLAWSALRNESLVILSVTTEATSSTMPWGLALAGATAAARRPPEVATTAVVFAERVMVVPAAVSRLGARWRPVMRLVTVCLSNCLRGELSGSGWSAPGGPPDGPLSPKGPKPQWWVPRSCQRSSPGFRPRGQDAARRSERRRGEAATREDTPDLVIVTIW